MAFQLSAAPRRLREAEPRRSGLPGSAWEPEILNWGACIASAWKG